MKNIKIYLSLILIGILFLNLPITSYADEITTSTSVNTNELTEVENIIGHYQFNVAAGSNINAKGDRGYSHVESVKSYEKNFSDKLLGNSSGGYLDGSYNEDGTIYKAYLVIETTTVDYSLPDYPITLVSDSNSMESKVEYYCYDSTYSSGNERRSGYIDVTDFVKENGYGWYYVCNIPYSIDGITKGSDQFAGWKLIVIEENYNVPMRVLKLDLGAQNVSGKGQSSSIEICSEGIKTSRTNDVTGQFLFGMAGADPGNNQNNSITYACENKNADEDNNYSYKTITTQSNVRTEKNPLTFISSRNGVPLNSEINFDNPIYFDGTSYSNDNSNGSYLAGAGDLELLDINSSSEYYHNVKLEKDKNLVAFKFETVSDCALMTSVLGIAVDIDVPEYNNDCNITYNKDTNEFVVDGTLSNISQFDDIGIISPFFSFEYDADLAITSYEGRITSLMQDDSAKYEKTLSNSEITVDKDGHKITFDIQGLNSKNEKTNKNIKNDVLYYKITLSVNKVKDCYESSSYISGTLLSSGTNTDLNLDKISASNYKNSLDGVVTKKSLSGKIIWNDNNDELAYRPQKVEVSLCMDSVPITTIDVTGRGNVWEYSFDDLDIYKSLDYEYEYEALVQTEYENYTITYSGNNITFNVKQETIEKNDSINTAVSCGEDLISDVSLMKLSLSSINAYYGIDDDIYETYCEKIVSQK